MSGSAPTRRVQLRVDGFVFDTWMRVRIVRSLKEICGSFDLDYLDVDRLAEATGGRPIVSPAPVLPLAPGQLAELRIDGTPVLLGWIDTQSLGEQPAEISARVAGRDLCGDLADCAAAPNGPAEWRNLALDAYARAICAPFGIGVQVQTDIGAPFPVIANRPHEHALPAIEQAARQRAVLIVSDGLGNLLLTSAGTQRAAGELLRGGNIVAASFENSWAHRYSDVYVKGQTARAAGNHAVPAAMTPATAPGQAPPPESATTAERAGIVMTGHAQDPEITRYRPDVRLVRTQGGASTVQEQAEWHVRIDRGQSLRATFTVPGWHGSSGGLWLPNTVVAVWEPYFGIDDDMLIEGVAYLYDEGGPRTEITVVGLSAYDRINEPARVRKGHR